jgi:thymidine phosphorylase
MVKRRYDSNTSPESREYYEAFMDNVPCPSCNGRRLRPEALAVTVGDKNISELCDMSVSVLREFFRNITFTESERAVAKEILNSGRALEAINRIIFAQGKASQIILGQLTHEIISDRKGIVQSIDNYRINQLGVLAGASQYSGAGLDLRKKVGDEVAVGDVLYVIHSLNSSDLALVKQAASSDDGFNIN